MSWMTCRWKKRGQSYVNRPCERLHELMLSIRNLVLQRITFAFFQRLAILSSQVCPMDGFVCHLLTTSIVFPELEDLKYFLANVRELGSSVLVPSAALRLRKNRDYEPEVVFWDNGSALSFMTAGTIDPYNGVFIGGGVLQYGGFVVCDLPPAFVSGL